MKIKTRSFVALAYKLTLDSGEVVDSSPADDPLTFVFGVGQIIPGLERALEGLKEGDEKSVKVGPEDGYGRHDKGLIQKIPRTSFPDDAPLEAGLVMTADTPHGSTNFTIISFDDKDVEVDFNHPLAGQNLNFEVTVIKVRKLTEEESQVIDAYEQQQLQGHQCGGCGSCGGHDDCDSHN